MTKPNPAVEPSMEEILASIRRIISDGDETPEHALQPQGGQNAPAHTTINDEGEPTAMTGSEEPAEMTSADGETDDDVFELTDEMLTEAPAGDPGPSNDRPGRDDVMPVEAGSGTDFVGTDTPPEGAGESDLVFGSTSTRPEAPAPEEAEAGEDMTHDASGQGRVNGSGAPESGAGAETAGAGADRLLSPEADASVASAFGRLADTMLSKESRTIEDLVREMLRPMLKEWLDDNLPHLVERIVREEIERVSRGRP